MHFDYCIIGGGITGATAALEIRNRDSEGSIAVFGDEPHELYSRVLLPHVVRGKIAEANATLPQSKQLTAGNIQIFSGASARAVSLDSAAHTITFADGQSHTFGKALIATGGRVRTLGIPGEKESGAHFFQTLDDARGLRNLEGGTAIVIGAGFIALELIMSFVHKGIPVTSLVRGEGYFRHSLDERSRTRLMGIIRSQNVNVITSAVPEQMTKTGETTTVHCANGASMTATHVGIGIGITPNMEWLEGSGVDTDNGILVNEQLQTSAPDVYAAGDVAECVDPYSGDRRIIGNWQNALFQGKIAGANMARTAEPAPYTALTTYAITVFGTPMLFVGAAEAHGATIERRVQETADAIYQFILKDGRLIGFTCIGPCMRRAELIAAITSRKEFAPGENI